MKVNTTWRLRTVQASMTTTTNMKITFYSFTVEPHESGDYQVTDGYNVHMAHYDKGSNSWDIYQPDKMGVIKHCYNLDDMNFDIKWYAEIKYPPIEILSNIT